MPEFHAFSTTIVNSERSSWLPCARDILIAYDSTANAVDNLKSLFPEQAKKALESALGGNKEKFEKWNREIKKREEVGGGGGAGGGGWFGWGGRFGWFSGDNFWQEAQQLILTLLGIIVLYLVVAKGELLLAVIFNPLLSTLRTTRNAFAYIISRLTRKSGPASDGKLADAPMQPAYGGAKSRVMKKWGSD
ncbi:hypothetical protein Cgig2_007983 [Carnegiea gigantea]|uniref:Uncharacterized protein n=1 Tax=Carnegiea gigantea TaxID=171969 RepID=A0A9Q1JNN8_9CARY|nr:hypothetical protein Cgig2_007983 [Carnegiea gigantea]